MKMERHGVLLVLSAPSGAGKTTVSKRLRASGQLRFSVSCTTRPPRPGECDGEDYWFVSEEEFLRRVDQGDFLEHARVHRHHYGTLKAPVRDAVLAGFDLMLDIDVQGAAQIRACQDPVIQSAHVDVFIVPPTLQELERRLRGRGTESEEQVRLRLEAATAEIPHWPDYDYVVVSGSMDEDYRKLEAIFVAEQCSGKRLRLKGEGYER